MTEGLTLALAHNREVKGHFLRAAASGLGL